MTAALGEIISAITAYKYVYSTEKQLQEALAKALKAKRIEFEREKDLGPHGVVDFMIGRVAIEVKTKGSPSGVARQLIRYCECADVDVLVLFTGRARLGTLPETLGGKRLVVVTIWATFL